MVGTFLNSFTTNKALSKTEREELVVAYKDDLCFDDFISKSEIAPGDIGSLLRNYGWFWVNITNDSGITDLIVNDISSDTDPENAVVRYFDFSRDTIQECNFSDFLLKVKSGGGESKIIRLLNTPKEGADPFATAPFFPSPIENPNARISVEYRSYGYEKTNGTRCEVTEGQLKVPSQVEHIRSTSAQRLVSKGTGEDAGHRIGARFAGPPDISNLALQNRVQNRWGSFYELEARWAEKLESGVKIFARITDLTKRQAARAYYRKVEWREIHPNGIVEDYELEFLNSRTYSPPKPGSPPRPIYTPRILPFLRNSIPPTIKQRSTAGILLGIEVITMGIEIYQAITGAIENANYIHEKAKLDSLKELNWWTKFEIQPEIALLAADEILPNVSSEQAYEIIRRIGTTTSDPEWDKVVITNITSANLEQLAYIASMELCLAYWMIVVGNPDKYSDKNAAEDVDKVGLVASKLSRLSFDKWFYCKWDSVRKKTYPCPMPTEYSKQLNDLYQDLLRIVEQDFEGIPSAEIFTIKDSAILYGNERNCYVFSSMGSKQIDFGLKRPKFTKTPYFNLPSFPNNLKDNILFGCIEIYAADIDTLYELTRYKWQLKEIGIPYDTIFTFHNPGMAFIEPDSLEPYYSS